MNSDQGMLDTAPQSFSAHGMSWGKKPQQIRQCLSEKSSPNTQPGKVNLLIHGQADKQQRYSDPVSVMTEFHSAPVATNKSKQ